MWTEVQVVTKTLSMARVRELSDNETIPDSQNDTIGTQTTTDTIYEEWTDPQTEEIMRHPKYHLGEHLTLEPEGLHAAFAQAGINYETMVMGQHEPKDNQHDNPRVHYLHDDHRQVAWTNCIYHKCKLHLIDKIKNDFFPTRYNDWIITEPYTTKEAEHWIIADGSLDYAIFTPDHERYPTDCRNSKDVYHCMEYKCRYHGMEKARQWHRGQSRYQRTPLRQHQIELATTEGQGSTKTNEQNRNLTLQLASATLRIEKEDLNIPAAEAAVEHMTKYAKERQTTMWSNDPDFATHFHRAYHYACVGRESQKTVREGRFDSLLDQPKNDNSRL